MAKYIFVTGGVVSSLGKGIAAASIGCLLESRGLKVACQKFDPYLNVDPGTMSPFQHGEVFVTDDGAETDLDLGHYERFTHSQLTQTNNLTSGRIYEQIIARERRGDYLGKTVQVIPHVTNEIKAAMKKVSADVDVVIAEIGGTVGDIESLPFLEAIRQMRHEQGRDNCLFVHVTLVPWIAAAQELKTKPTQHSVKELRALGIQPDILLCRCERFIPQEMKEKIALFCDVDVQAVITARDVKSVYEVPVGFAAEGVDEIVMRLLKIDAGPRDLTKWTAMLERLDNPRGRGLDRAGGQVRGVRRLLQEPEGSAAARRAGAPVEGQHPLDRGRGRDGRGLGAAAGGLRRHPGAGRFRQARHRRDAECDPVRARAQGAVLRNLPGHADAGDRVCAQRVRPGGADSTEFNSGTPHRVIFKLRELKGIDELGGTMRLGSWACRLAEGSFAHEAYGAREINERHRHRYEFNREYEERLKAAGLKITGETPDNTYVEICEIADHPWYLGCQFHPEFKSKPMEPHPLFKSFIGAAERQRDRRQSAIEEPLFSRAD